MAASVIFGSTTGMTEQVANQVAAELGAQAVNVASADASAFAADTLVLGVSTWGVGDMQDDWAARLEDVKPLLAGKKVVVFGLGDSIGFADSYCAAAQALADAAVAAGATLAGEVVKIDEANEGDKTPERIAAIVAAAK